MSDTAKYADLVKLAETAVKGVKDPELRRVAFEKVLDSLLQSSDDSSRKGVAKPSGTGTREATAATPKKICACRRFHRRRRAAHRTAASTPSTPAARMNGNAAALAWKKPPRGPGKVKASECAKYMRSKEMKESAKEERRRRR